MIALLLDHLWQSSLFLGGAGLLTLALRQNSANVRFWLWFAASAKFLVPFAILTTLGAYFLTPITTPLSAPSLILMEPVTQPFSGAKPVLAMTSVAAAPATTHLDLSLILLALWAIGFWVISARWMVRWWQLRLLLRDAVPSPFVAPIAVKSSASRLEPGLVGIFRPVIILPEGIVQQLTPGEMNAIVAHELCHWRRRDNLLAAFHMSVEALFWFFPLVWWLGARLNAERERACDESVLAAGNDPKTYAEGILKVCRVYLQSPLACAAGVSGAELKKRMEVIMENQSTIRLGKIKTVVLAGAALAALALPVVLGVTAAPPALAQGAATPHLGTEAAVRHQVESMEKGQEDFDVMAPALSRAAHIQSERSLANVQKWGALKSITFRGNQDGNDVYWVEFENQLTAWTIAPLQADGKISGLTIGPVIKRDGNGPSQGLEAAIRRELDGNFAGKPALEIMSSGLQTATLQQWPIISADGKNLGAVKTITFQEVNLRGWDIYHVTFANGTATVQAAPLTDGKLSGLLHTDFLLPHQRRHPGTEAWMRRHIAALLNGTPNFGDMKPGLAFAVQEQWSGQQALWKSLGALQSLTFEGGGSNGTDVYLGNFQNGKIRWNIEAPDTTGKLNTLYFRKMG